jgi:hypothetical protein
LRASAARGGLKVHGGLRTALLLLLWLLLPALIAAQTSSDLAHLADDPVMHALVRHHHGRYTLADTGLLLDPKGTPASELQRSLERLRNETGFRCRYPTRDAFLRSRPGLDPAPAEPCPGLEEFERRVPVSRISLVFVAENIEQPASIMGHLVLKLAGEDAHGRTREHGISFFHRSDRVEPAADAVHRARRRHARMPACHTA